MKNSLGKKIKAMNKDNRRSLFLLFVLILLAVIAVGFLTGFFTIKDIVTQKFGRASSDLTFTQQIIFPFELFFNRDKLTGSLDAAGEDQVFEINQGESVSMMCLRLEGAGLIEDAELLRTYLIYTGLDRHIQAGEYRLNPVMSPVQIAAELLDATPEDAIVTILPGWRIEEVGENIAASGLDIGAEEFIQAAYSPSPELLSILPVESLSSLEGFLYPGTYVFPRETDLNTVLETILAAFSENVDVTLVDGFERQGLTIPEAITLASIVEKEAVLNDEKPLISSVFYNRLEVGMRLETDPTVQYALGYQTETSSWWKSPLTGNDLAVESPYNTYIYFGLTPTPICNPDLSSLRAVSFPAETPYFYFRSACDGSGRHNFAITYEEHLDNACE
jgi:UPF0755 protein